MKFYLTIVFTIFTILSGSAQYTISGGIGTPYMDELNSTNNEKIYVLNTLSNSSISYSTNKSVVRFYKYSKSRSDRESIPSSEISSIISGGTTTYTIQNLEDSRGYFAEIDGINTNVIWIIDYSLHLPIINSLEFNQTDDECEFLKISVNKSDDLFFYTLEGSQLRLTRKYDIEYNNLKWNSTDFKFENTSIKNENIEIATDYVVEAPLTDTQFKISGDQYAKYFKINISFSSPVYTAIAVQGYIKSEQLTENPTSEGEDTDISAPTEFQFYGIANEPATYFYTWFIYKTTDMENPIVRYTDQNVKYTFRESGEYTVQLEVANQSSICTFKDEMNIQTATSELDVPNILFLDGEHKFRVTYKSLSNFKCTIFNRWGNKIYEFTDPSQGWNGKYKGKDVTPGVYFYVIRAKGADGKERNKSGDINVIRPR